MQRYRLWRVGALLRALLLTLAVASPGWTQSSSSVVSARVVMATDAAHPDSALKLAVLAQVEPGFHINDHKPTLDYLIPTAIKLEPSEPFSIKEVVYPKGTLAKFPFSDEPISVYQGSLVVGVLLQVGKAAAPGAYSLKGKLSYQACNDHACLAPANVPIAIAIKIVARGIPVKAAETNVFQRIKFD
jgi:DsbC/DsbD-like thiol-disulfide interchange protein